MLVHANRGFPGPLFMMRGSALFDIGPWVIGFAAFSEAVVRVNAVVDLTWANLTTLPFTLVGLALSIFLGFRNNACYDRWWEARKLWGKLINTSRSSARQALTLFRGEGAPAVAERWVNLQVAYVHALRFRLRQQRAARIHELEPFVGAETLAELELERNVPIGILHRMALLHREAMDQGLLDPFHLPVLEGTLTTLTDIQGGCERIKNTPVPLSYTELTHRIVAIYVLLLPFGILTTAGELTPVVVAMVAFCFLGLDDVGTQIEDPFEEDPNDLPLHQMSVLIENDLRQRLGATDLRPDLTPVDRVLL
jgi:putative membrane protein